MYHSVKHTGRGHDICTAFRMADRDPVHEVERGVVVDVRPAGTVAYDAAVAVIGIFACTDIGYHHHAGNMFLDRPYCLLHDPVFCICTTGPGIFQFGDPEEEHRMDTLIIQGPCMHTDPPGRVPELAGHRTDRFRL